MSGISMLPISLIMHKWFLLLFGQKRVVVQFITLLDLAVDYPVVRISLVMRRCSVSSDRNRYSITIIGLLYLVTRSPTSCQFSLHCSVQLRA